ncbi:MAG: 4Fe-4S binding protein [Marinilabiliaceae bacterium]|nr:4Fe-4S binding protein [Marinilabiliaceae bacterium]
MIREMVKIDEDLCNGCGECVPNCHEGALQIIDKKAVLVSDLMCDGLGACIGHCPLGAISIEKREAEAYNEKKVMELMVTKGKNTVIAHLKHLKDHNETEYLQDGIRYLKETEKDLPFALDEVIISVHKPKISVMQHQQRNSGGGCPGSKEMTFGIAPQISQSATNPPSQLRQWPVQMHLINPNASYFTGADVVLAADCVAFAMGNFHEKYLKGKSLAIACPKLDNSQEVYVDKITAMIDEAKINTLTAVVMQVPCCMGITRMIQIALSKATRKIPVKQAVISIEGNVLNEEWL